MLSGLRKEQQMVGGALLQKIFTLRLAKSAGVPAREPCKLIDGGDAIKREEQAIHPVCL